MAVRSDATITEVEWSYVILVSQLQSVTIADRTFEIGFTASGVEAHVFRFGSPWAAR